MKRAVFKPFRSFSRRADQEADGMSAELERKVEAKEKKNVKKAKGSNEKKKTEVGDTGVETKEEDNHEIGVLYARELGISEEFVLRMVEAFAYFDKVLIIILILGLLCALLIGTDLIHRTGTGISVGKKCQTC